MSNLLILHEELLQVLKYDPLTGEFTWKLTLNNGVKEGDKAGHKSAAGYITVRYKYRSYYAHRLAWLYMYGEWPTLHVDHINQNKLDNRISNLRLATHSQNMRNTPKRSCNSSGIKGVHWRKDIGKWGANIRVSGQLRHLGFFASKEEAATVRAKAAKKYHGELAHI